MGPYGNGNDEGDIHFRTEDITLIKYIMNTSKLIFFLSTILLNLPVFSQTQMSERQIEDKLDSLQDKLVVYDIRDWTNVPEEKKLDYLALKAKEILLMLGPKYYQDNLKVQIEKGSIQKGESRNDALLGEKIYTVDLSTPIMEGTPYHNVTVTFFNDSGKAWKMIFNNWSGVHFEQRDPYQQYEMGERAVYSDGTESLRLGGRSLQEQTDSLLLENRKKQEKMLEIEKAQDEILLKTYDSIIGKFKGKPVKTFPPAQRDGILIAIARKLILNREPFSYRGFYETPEIEYLKLNESNYPAMVSKNFGKMAYAIRFYEGSGKKEIDYIIYILEDTGQKYLLNKNDWMKLQQ